MDFLNTLMLYMSLTFASTVQAAPVTLPIETATPTPTAYVEVVDMPTPTLGPTATPTPTVVPTQVPTPSPEPTPTISPNPQYPILRYRTKSADVKKMQQRLIELGYLNDKADGNYGFNTRRAVIMFQKAHGLTPDGDAGPQTLTFLYEYADVRYNPDATYTPVPSDTPTPPPAASDVPADVKATDTPAPEFTANPSYKTLRYGNSGNNVKKMQKRLIELGYLGGKADGKFGLHTYNAVKLFQQVHGLTADGVAGRITLTYLYEYPGVMRNPDAPTPTPEPTLTPEPTIAPPEALMVLQPDAAVVLTGTGTPVTLAKPEGSVMVAAAPRLYQYVDGTIFVSLYDLCEALDSWTLTVAEDGNAFVLTIGDNEATIAITGNEDVTTLFGDLAVRARILNALGVTTVWDSSEKTLLLNDASTAGMPG